MNVVDFGCGPGSYIEPASLLAGENGKVYRKVMILTKEFEMRSAAAI
jgi:hypothetical protein